MKKPVIIFGAGSLGRHALDIFKSHDIVVYGFLDDDHEMHGQEIAEVSVLGEMQDQGFLKLIDKKAEAFVALEDNDRRRQVVELLMENRKAMPMNAVHNMAYLASSAAIGHGNFIGPGAILQSFGNIGQHNIIRANASIGVGVQIGDYVQVGQNASIGDNVIIENGAIIGANATIIAGVKIGEDANIGPGSVVISNAESDARLFGNPAQNWKKN